MRNSFFIFTAKANRTKWNQKQNKEYKSHDNFKVEGDSVKSQIPKTFTLKNFRWSSEIFCKIFIYNFRCFSAGICSIFFGIVKSDINALNFINFNFINWYYIQFFLSELSNPWTQIFFHALTGPMKPWSLSNTYGSF